MTVQINVTKENTYAIQKMLIEAGFKNHIECGTNQEEPAYLGEDGHIVLNFEDYEMDHYSDRSTDSITLDTLVRIIFNDKQMIMIGEHKVEFTNEGMKVGCELITYEKIEEINKFLVEKEWIKCACM